MSVQNTKNPSEPWYNVTGKIVSMVLGVVALAGMAVSAILFLSGLMTLPAAFSKQAKEVSAIKEEVSNLTVAFNSSRPEILSVHGIGVVSTPVVKRGESVVIIYTLRRNISCDALIDIRFWDHKQNILVNEYSYTRPSNKAPMSPTPVHHPVRIKIPSNLPAGIYSYSPILKPIDCGVYLDQTLGLSEKFEVVE